MGTRWTAGLRRAGLATLLVLGIGSQAACEPTCQPPYRVVGAQQAVPPSAPPTGPWPVTGVARPPVRPVMDTDGDGAAETTEVVDEGRRFVVHRASGDLELTLEPPAMFTTGAPVVVPAGEHNLAAAGDLDADGRTDLLLTVFTRAPASASDVPQMVLYLVSGATPDGAHPLVEVGATPVPTPDGTLLRAVGDLDGDGRDDLLSETAEGPQVWFGADLDLDPGAPPPPGPSLRPPGRFLDVLDLRQGRSVLVLLTRDATAEDRTYEVSLWLPTADLRFTTAGSPFPTAVPPLGGAALVDDGEEVWLTVQFSYRSGTQRWAWDLDELCAGAAPSGA